MREEVAGVKIVDTVLKYANDIINLTREEKRFVMGASPRAMILLVKAAQARAFLEGRDFVTPDDIKEVAVPVLSHRVKLGIGIGNPQKVIKGLIAGIKVPTEDYNK